jgi:hypothetical protein
LSEEWSIEIDLIEESYIRAVESMGIDAGHEVLQIFADPFKPESRKSREDRACRREVEVDLPSLGEIEGDWN